MNKFFLFTIYLITSFDVSGNNKKELYTSHSSLEASQFLVTDTPSEEIIVQNAVRFKRGKAILFTVFTGFLGGHRIYLGTHHRTPILYSITLGGLGILPIIDLANIIFTKDLSRFEKRPQIIMWGNNTTLQ